MGYAVIGMCECVCVEAPLMTPVQSDILCIGWLKTMLFQRQGNKKGALWVELFKKKKEKNLILKMVTDRCLKENASTIQLWIQHKAVKWFWMHIWLHYFIVWRGRDIIIHFLEKNTQLTRRSCCVFQDIPPLHQPVTKPITVTKKEQTLRLSLTVKPYTTPNLLAQGICTSKPFIYEHFFPWFRHFNVANYKCMDAFGL